MICAVFVGPVKFNRRSIVAAGLRDALYHLRLLLILGYIGLSTIYIMITIVVESKIEKIRKTNNATVGVGLFYH